MVKFASQISALQFYLRIARPFTLVDLLGHPKLQLSPRNESPPGIISGIPYNKASSAWPLLTQPYLRCVSLRSGLSYYLQSAGTLGLSKHDGKETRCLIPSSPPGFDASAVIIYLNKLPVVLASSHHGLLSVYKQ